MKQRDALLDQMRPARDKSAPHPGPVIGNPCLGQEIRCQQLRQDPRVDLVSFHLRFRDRPCLARVRHHHLRHQRPQHHRDRVAVRRRLQRHLVIWLERLRPLAQILGSHPDPGPDLGTGRPPRSQSAQTSDAHPSRRISPRRLLSNSWIEEPPGGHDRNGFALAAQSGQSQGRPSTSTSSQLTV